MKHTYICIGVMENDIPVMCYGIVINAQIISLKDHMYPLYFLKWGSKDRIFSFWKICLQIFTRWYNLLRNLTVDYVKNRPL